MKVNLKNIHARLEKLTADITFHNMYEYALRDNEYHDIYEHEKLEELKRLKRGFLGRIFNPPDRFRFTRYFSRTPVPQIHMDELSDIAYMFRDKDVTVQQGDVTPDHIKHLNMKELAIKKWIENK